MLKCICDQGIGVTYYADTVTTVNSVKIVKVTID